MISKLLSRSRPTSGTRMDGACALATTNAMAQSPSIRIQNEINNSDTIPLRGSHLQIAQTGIGCRADAIEREVERNEHRLQPISGAAGIA